mgnify:CR=1 FL=1
MPYGRTFSSALNKTNYGFNLDPMMNEAPVS